MDTLFNLQKKADLLTDVFPLSFQSYRIDIIISSMSQRPS